MSGAAAESNGDPALFDDDRHRSVASGILQHELHLAPVTEHIVVFEKDLSGGEVLTGLACVGSGVLSEYQNLALHKSLLPLSNTGCTAAATTKSH